jgi:hypothetical protein
MKIGTKSVLFGAHAFWLHPWFVALSWWKLYGFPWDIRLWFAFFLHDIGYYSLPNIDGEEGESHVELGANIMGYLFGEYWKTFCLCHSRYYSKKIGKHFSRLCVADKYAVTITPWWMFLPMVNLSGEIEEYRREGRSGKYLGIDYTGPSQRKWFRSVQETNRQWVEKHKNGELDNWTHKYINTNNMINER